MAALLIAYCYYIKFSAIADYKHLPLLSKILWLCVSDEVFSERVPIEVSSAFNML